MTPHLGFGVSGPLGQKWFSKARTRALIDAALEGGVTHFDTAPFYFDAEARLGAALRALRRNDVFVSTKTGTRRANGRLVKDFSETAMRADVEQSRRRLSRDVLDLLYLHGPTTEEFVAARPVLEALKRDGSIRGYGVCGEGEPLRRAIAAGADAVMGVYNIVDRRNERIFEEAKRMGVTTVAIAPLAQGLIDRRYFMPRDLADLWRMARGALRGRYDERQIAEARALLAGEDPVTAALGFVMAGGFIDVVLTTTTKPRHLADSLGAAALPIDPALYARLRNLALDPPFGGA
jgi:aryl-alcohol dehydrogenase-like predicted oxidoreductase